MQEAWPKDTAREDLRARRRARSIEEISAGSAAMIDRLVTELLDAHRSPTVAAYAPTTREPGSTLLLPALTNICDSIYLPVSLDNGHLHWSLFDSAAGLSAGAFGISEPTGPRLDVESLRSCSLIVVPTLGLTADGVRLGKGGGYYDRALSHITSWGPERPLVVTMLFDDEFVNVHTEQHDMPVDLAFTPTRTVRFSGR